MPMSDYDPQFDKYPDAQQDFSNEMVYTGPVPMSGMAVAGLVSSLVGGFCCPVLGPLLAIIFGIVGYILTAGGARRGRGLAIAGLLITLLVGIPLQGFGGWWFRNIVKDELLLVTSMMEMDSNNISTQSAIIYELGSPNFKSRVTEKQLADWLTDEFGQLGGVQSIIYNQQQASAMQQSGTNRFKRGFIAQFPEKTVTIYFDMTFDIIAGHWLIEDVLIEDKSCLQSIGGTPPSTTGQGEESTGVQTED